MTLSEIHYAPYAKRSRRQYNTGCRDAQGVPQRENSIPAPPQGSNHQPRKGAGTRKHQPAVGSWSEILSNDISRALGLPMWEIKKKVFSSKRNQDTVPLFFVHTYQHRTINRSSVAKTPAHLWDTSSRRTTHTQGHFATCHGNALQHVLSPRGCGTGTFLSSLAARSAFFGRPSLIDCSANLVLQATIPSQGKYNLHWQGTEQNSSKCAWSKWTRFANLDSCHLRLLKPIRITMFPRFGVSAENF